MITLITTITTITSVFCRKVNLTNKSSCFNLLLRSFKVLSMTHSNFSWEEIQELSSATNSNRRPQTFIKIDPDDDKYSDFRKASHVLIYAKTEARSFEIYDRKAIVLMQMRFDGYLGFAGGLVDPGETPVEAVNREVREEMGWNGDEKGPVTAEHFQFAHLYEEGGLVLYFYAIEVSEEKISEIEALALNARDVGEEVLGLVRIPLYTMGDAYRGFPCFLDNKFVGNAKMQLLECLINLNILSKDYITRALTAQPDVIT